MKTKGNIGIFDSGLGGLWILKYLRESLPDYNYIFFGDQAHVPYGTKSLEDLFACTTKALSYLYAEKNCTCVILACNTTSSAIFSDLRAWVEKEFPGRKVFGLVLPTVLAIPTNDPIAVFATPRTVESHAFKEEIFRQASGGSILPMVIEVSLPELASRIEHGENVREYIGSFNTPSIEDAKTGVLCCTHYGIVREDFMHAFPQIKKWISQEEIIPPFFATYLNEKKEFADTLAHDGVLEVYVSKESAVFNEWLLKWYGEAVEVNVVTL